VLLRGYYYEKIKSLGQKRIEVGGTGRRKQQGCFQGKRNELAWGCFATKGKEIMREFLPKERKGAEEEKRWE